MISLLFISIAAFFNACMDAFENENFGESIFKNWDRKFWYKRESWKHAKKIFSYKLDAWHISKTLMILFAALSVVFHNKHYVNEYVDVLIIGVLWVATFNFFYHKVFKID